MATGYTHDVSTGEVADFRTFALRCARAFGATVTQRDEPTTVPPKHREPNVDYHYKEIAEQKARLASLSSMSFEEVQAAIAEERREIEERNARYMAEKDEKRARYEAMLSEVYRWEPPTTDHAGLKKFMAEQLSSSIDFDCGNYSTPVPNLTPDEWRTERKATAVRNIAYHEKAIEEEIARCKDANDWIDALYASLPTEAVNPQATATNKGVK